MIGSVQSIWIVKCLKGRKERNISFAHTFTTTYVCQCCNTHRSTNLNSIWIKTTKRKCRCRLHCVSINKIISIILCDLQFHFTDRKKTKSRFRLINVILKMEEEKKKKSVGVVWLEWSMESIIILFVLVTEW
jgi:hypothetical protein